MSNRHPPPKNETPEQREARHAAARVRLAPYKWKPGESGNPKGYSAKGRTRALSEALVQLLLEQVPGDKKNRTWARIAAEGLLRGAAKGSAINFMEAANRTEGKVKEEIELSGTLTADPGELLRSLIAAALSRKK